MCFRRSQRGRLETGDGVVGVRDAALAGYYYYPEWWLSPRVGDGYEALRIYQSHSSICDCGSTDLFNSVAVTDHDRGSLYRRVS
jgi:hypothetical protein